MGTPTESRKIGDRRRSSSFRKVVETIVPCFIPSTTDENLGHQNDEVASSSWRSASTQSTNRFRYKNHGREEGSPKGFSMKEIIMATGNFSSSNKIGEGHFGTIYRGELKDGLFVAVKRAKQNVQAKQFSSEFNNEIKTLSNIQHLNLVRFLGYLEQDNERIIVVEYVGNGNLREHLNGSRGRVLEIAERLQIAIDVAHAVTYLHTYIDHPIIHRDIKASNILITENFRAKVADFGFARLSAEEPDATHVVTQIKGTAGYLDPEYLRTYELTDKSDVYSFGVVLVELITGRRPIEPKRKKERMTTHWAMQKHKEGDTMTLLDPKLRRTQESTMVAEKILDLAQLCLAPSRQQRPSMRKCAEMLWNVRKDFQKLDSFLKRSEYSINSKEETIHHHSGEYSTGNPEMFDLSENSSSTIMALNLVREGAAWDMNTHTHMEEK